MSKIVKRVISGFLATVLFVSAFGSDVFTEVLEQNMYADSGGSVPKKGSTDPDNKLFTAEKDTDGTGAEKLYNTNYGLHTDKTVSKAYSDGRTFDLDLESWYVGANPADIGFVLDASGSMAWSTTSLDPYYVGNKIEKNTILSNEELAEILHTDYTDNDPVSYKNYHYYIYDPRNTVNEFVPIGYWDANKVIGYYSFDNTLENELGSSATMIAHADSETGIFTSEPCVDTPEIQFKNDGLDLSETDKKGNVIINLSNQLSVEKNITISFELMCNAVNEKFVPQSPILYFGDGTTSNYLALERGRSNNGNGAARGFYLLENGSQVIETDNILNSSPFAYDSWLNFELKITNDTSEPKVELTISDSKNTKPYSSSLNFNLNSEKLYLVLGGNEILPHGKLEVDGYSDIDPTNLKGNYIKDLKITGTTTEGKNFNSSFSLSNKSGLIDSENGIEVNYRKQVDGAAEFDTVNPPDSVTVEPIYGEKDGTKYLNVTKTSKAGGGILLDTTPSDPNNFSISFKITNSLEGGGKDDITGGNAEIMYIGNMAQTGNCYKILRSGSDAGSLENDRRHIRFCEGNSAKVSGNYVFQDKKWKTVTLTVKNGTVRIYVNGADSTEKSGINTLPKDIRFIIAGLADEYAGKDIWIDDLYVYDTALTENQVKTIYNFSLGKDQVKNLNVAYDETGEEVYAQIQDSTALGKNFPGWYYINSSSGWDRYEANKTGKQLIGLISDDGWEGYSSKTIYEVSIPSAYSEDSNFISTAKVADEAAKKADIFNDDERPQSKEETTPIKFFVDFNGYLRCFAQNGGTSDSSATRRTFCSYVYERDPDNQEIKSETLEKALTEFVRQLGESSEVSKVSATRFSTREAPVDSNSEKLVAHQWENANKFEEEIFVKTNDENGVVDTTPKQDSYVYNLTGGTATWTGLKSFYENLEKTNTNPNSKYLVIFTDGRDTYNNNDTTGNDDGGNSANLDNFPTGHDGNLKNELAGKWADFLKEEGYTIYCVMLASGSISETANPDEYKTTCEFLASLAGNDDVTVEYNKDDKGKLEIFNQYVYPVVADVELEEGEEPPLNRAFNTILEKIMQDITGYTVQDYIDPRFDLITYQNKLEGEVLKLGALGNVTLAGGTPENITSGGYEYKTKDGKTATLYYDSEKDMYYLRWTNQSIPSMTKPVNSEADGPFISVWDSTITIKAKDDFIGGNAILTNGNEAGMNLVYNPSSIKADGTERAQLATMSGTKYYNGDTGISPSKGFPRTTVNVRLLDIETKPLNEVIYLGEVVSPTLMLNKLENGYMTGSYYLEYLERYAYRLHKLDSSTAGTDKPLIELLNKWLGIDDTNKAEKTFTIPYIYLPDPVYKNDEILEDSIQNNTGKDLNQKDIVGFLTYTWKRVDPDNPEEEYKFEGDDDIMDEFVVKSTDRIYYSLELKFTPLPENEDKFVDFTEFVKNFDNHFIDGDKYFKAEGEKFEDVTDNKWEFGTRDDYLQALVDEDFYEWDSDYKETAGTPQVEKDRKYGDAEVKDGSLIASTTYTKDVVDAGLALEMIVKGENLQGDTKITKEKTFTFEATRNYKDSATDTVGEPKDYNETYKLTFTVKDGVPDDTSKIEDGEYYTIWATLTDVKEIDETTKAEKAPYTYPANALPIGTYTITPDLNTDQFTIKGDVKFTNFTADNNKSSFVYDRFPENVYNVSQTAIGDDAQDDYEYLIWHDAPENLDYSSNNVAENKQGETSGSTTQSLTFYFGTNADNEKGSKNEEVYTKDRLGIMLLSSGEKYLTISKKVTNSRDTEVLNNKWVFSVGLTCMGVSTEEEKNFSVRWTDKNGKPLTGDGYPDKIKFKKLGALSSTYTQYYATIGLANGESVTFNQLGDNWHYTVIEARSSQKDGFNDPYRYKMMIKNGDTDGKPKYCNSSNVSLKDGGIPDDNGKQVQSSGDVGINSYVYFTNEFPVIELPSAGGNSIDIKLYGGIMLAVSAGLYLAIFFNKKSKKKRGE